MSQPHPQVLDQITAVAEKWRRRCNGLPAEGIPVGADELRAVLTVSTGITVYDDGTITWRGPAGQFTAEPVRDEVLA